MQQTLMGNQKTEDAKVEIDDTEKFTAQVTLTPRKVDTYILKEKNFIDMGYLYGSTTVWCDGDKYFFVGDIQHCGLKTIAHNAKKIRQELISNGLRCGHMNYNDPPTFDGVFDKAHFEKDNEIYKYDIYTWNVGDEPIIFDIYGIEAQTEVYYNAEEDKKFYEKLYERIRKEEEYAKSIGEELK